MRFSHQRTAQSELPSNGLTSNMPFQLDGVCPACSVAMGLLWAAEYFHLPSDPHWFYAFCGDVMCSFHSPCFELSSLILLMKVSVRTVAAGARWPFPNIYYRLFP